MRTFITILFLLNISSAFAAEGGLSHNISTESRYYNSTNDYHYYGVEYKLSTGFHSIGLNYNAYDEINPDYDKLQTLSASYFYLSPRQLFGGIVASRSDKPFDDIETTTMMAFYAHSIFPQSWVDSKQMNLFVGAGVSREKVFGSYVLPVLSFNWQHKYFTLSIGYPRTSVSFQPHKMHTFKFSWLSENTLGAEYIFTPTKADSFSVEYTAEQKKYAISDVVQTPGRKDDRLVYDRDWLRGRYTHDFGWIALSVLAGYSPRGYVYEGDGDDYERSDARRISTATEFGIFINIKP